MADDKKNAGDGQAGKDVPVSGDGEQQDKPENGREEPEVPESGDSIPEQMSEEELRAELEKHFREQSVSDLVVQFLVTLSNLAYMKMGLTEDTKDAKDLEQAGLAIDSFKALLDSAGKRLPTQDASALAGALSSMQLTFVKVSSPDAGTAEKGPEEADGSAPDAGGGGAREATEDAGGGNAGDPDEGGTGEQTSDKPKGDDPASRLWVPGKE